MPLVRLNWSPDTRMLRQFGWIACAAGVLLAAFVWEGWASVAAAGVAVFSGVASLLRPSLNRPLFLGLSIVTYPIGLVVSTVVLVVLFYLVVTPIGLLLRVFRHDPLTRRFDRERTSSYWSPARPARPNEDYFRQY
jgi:hypothetical protein